MELKKLNPGYPCHKYIARNLKSEGDILGYAKAFVTTLLNTKYADYDMTLTLLHTSLMEVSNDLTVPDFSKFGIDAKSACLNIVNNPDVVSFKACNAYYKKADGKTPCCRICPISKIYYNTDEATELSVMKFMLSSKKNLDLVLSYIEPDYFRCAIDVCMELPAKKAYVVPILKELAVSALKPNVRMNLFDTSSFKIDGADSAYDIVWEDVINRIPREYRITTDVAKNENWARVLKTVVLNRITASADISESDIIDLMNDYLVGGGETVTTERKEFTQLSVLDIDLSSIPNAACSESHNEKPSDVEDCVVSEDIVKPVNIEVNSASVPDGEPNDSDLDKASGEYDFKEERFEEASASFASDVVPDYNIVDVPPAAALPDEELLPAETLPMGESLSSNPETVGEVHDATPDMVNPNVSVADESSTGGELTCPESDIKSGIESESKTSADDSLSNISDSHSIDCIDMITHVFVDNSCVNNYMCYIDEGTLPSRAYDGILNDKLMPIEVVKYDDHYCFLIYSRHTKEFYLSSVNSCNKQITSLISRNMVRKVCHTPYYLYGLCRINNYQVRNVFSLQTMHTRATGKVEVLSYESFIEAYENRPNVLSLIPEHKKESCIYLYGMPSYKGIEHVISNMLNALSHPIMIDMDRGVDEAIGSSFFYKRNFEDDGLLTCLLPNGKFVYREEYKDVPFENGKTISYFLENSDDAYNLFRYLLWCLSKEGYVMKLNFQIIGWKNNYISFYADESCYEFFTSIMEIYMLDYGALHKKSSIRIRQLVRDSIPPKLDIRLSKND